MEKLKNLATTFNALVVTAILLVGIAITIVLNNKEQIFKSYAEENVVDIFLNPDKIEATEGKKNTVDVFIDTKTAQVSAVTLYVSTTDSEILKIKNLIPKSESFIVANTSIAENISTMTIIAPCNMDNTCDFITGVSHLFSVETETTGIGEAKLSLQGTKYAVVGQDDNEFSDDSEIDIIVKAISTNTSTPTPTPGSVQQVVLNPIEDTHVKEKYSNRNYGSEDSIVSDGDPRVIPYLKYDLTEFDPETIVSAKLQIIPSKTRSVEKRVVLVDDVSWKENQMTWDNRPSLGGPIALIDERLYSGKDKVVDITDVIKDNTGAIVSIAIEDTSGGYTLEVGSKESGQSGIKIILEIRN